MASDMIGWGKFHEPPFRFSDGCIRDGRGMVLARLVDENHHDMAAWRRDGDIARHICDALNRECYAGVSALSRPRGFRGRLAALLRKWASAISGDCVEPGGEVVLIKGARRVGMQDDMNNVKRGLRGELASRLVTLHDDCVGFTTSPVGDDGWLVSAELRVLRNGRP